MSITQVKQLGIKLNILKRSEPKIIYRKSESEKVKLKDLKLKVKIEQKQNGI
jgi:hypothetical protein